MGGSEQTLPLDSIFRLALDHGYSRETGVGSDEVGDQKLRRFLLRLQASEKKGKTDRRY